MNAVEAQRRGGVLVVRLNRPEAGNRFDIPMLASLRSAFESAEGARAVLLTHAGAAFCLGGNLGDAREQHAGSVQAFAGALKAALRSIYECPVPVVCALEGDAEGGGLSIVEACGMAAASTSARFAIPEMLSGMAPVVSFASACRAIPPKRLMEMALLGACLDAAEAERIGLITRAVAPGTAQAVAMEWIERMLAANDGVLGAIQQLRQRMDGGRYLRQLDAAGDLLVGVMMHRDTWEMLDRREGKRDVAKSGC